jgi:hypothetical protein
MVQPAGVQWPDGRNCSSYSGVPPGGVIKSLPSHVGLGVRFFPLLGIIKPLPGEPYEAPGFMPPDTACLDGLRGSEEQDRFPSTRASAFRLT